MLNNPLLYSHVPDITRSIQKRNNFIIQVYSPYTLIKESTQSQKASNQNRINPLTIVIRDIP